MDLYKKIFFNLKKISSTACRQYWLLFLLFLLCNTLTFAQTEQQALQKIANLNALINTAENQGIDVSKERMTIEVAELFLLYANWDAANVAINTSRFQELKPLPVAMQSNYTAGELAALLPNYERQKVIEVLDEAMAYLNTLISGQNTRKPTTTIDLTALELQGNKIVQNGKPVFLNDWTWDPAGLGRGYFVPSNLERTPNGTVRLKVWPRNNLEQSSNSGILGTPFLGQTSVPGYLSNDYPDILQAMTTFTKYDIDHPQARVLHSDLFREVVPIFKDKKSSELGYMLTNEPHWNTAVGVWDVIVPSQYTKNKFVLWLEDKHNNNINNLRAAWTSNPASFQQAVNGFPFPVPYSLQGQGEWYDWMKFNQDRVTEHFTFLRDEIRVHDPNARVHIKLIPGQWAGDKRDHGLDFEALTDLSQIIGNDAGSHKSYMWGNTQSWEAHYAFDWSSLSMSYDFFASVKPDAINYNSEAHFLSKVSFRDIFLEPAYARASHWLATLQGMDVATNWFWGRNADGSPVSRGGTSYPGSILQQPKVYHEVLSTMIDINAHAEEMDALQQIRKPVRLFYSETSAINSDTYMDGIFDVYESLYFDGLPLGFATQNIIENQDASNWDVIVVTHAEDVKPSELAALQSYLNAGGTVIIDNISLANDEYGRSHNQSLNAGSGNLISTNLGGIKNRVTNFLDARAIQPAVNITETNPLGTNVKGCVNRSVILNNRIIANLVNVSKEPTQIDISLNDGTGFTVVNLINGNTLSEPFTMSPEEVLLLEIVPDCVNLQLHAWLEGAYNTASNEMTTVLSSARKLLPGQTPNSQLATPTPSGQPYHIAPWNYSGTEGTDWTDADYTGDETDWILASFRAGTAKNTEVGMTAGLLMKDGSIEFPDRCVLTADMGNALYVVLEHRNHIGIMTPQPVNVINGVLAYDFRSSDSYRDPTSFGQKQLANNAWAMFAGDADQSDFPSFDIQGTDKTIWFENNGIFDYYLSPDFNLDGDVNGQDKSLWFDNNGISSRVPK